MAEQRRRNQSVLAVGLALSVANQGLSTETSLRVWTSALHCPTQSARHGGLRRVLIEILALVGASFMVHNLGVKAV